MSRALKAWRGVLADSGAVAFSHPRLFTDAPSEAALAFWVAEPGRIETETATCAQIAAVGSQVLATRPLSDAAWAAYYDPLLARCDALEAAGTSDPVAAAIAAARKEAFDWRAVAGETGYVLYVVRPARAARLLPLSGHPGATHPIRHLPSRSEPVAGNFALA